MPKAKSITPKPEWFDLEKYKPFQQLSIKEWEAQLYVRSRLNLHLRLLCNEHPESESYQRAVENNPLPFSLEEIQDCPIVTPNKIQSGWGYDDLSPPR